MSLFRRTKATGFLGVDIGAGGIKVVELSNTKGRAILQTYGYSERRPDESPLSPFEHTREAGELLAAICKQAGTTSTKAMAALPLSNVFSAIVAVPRRKDARELKALVDTQVAKLTPLPLAEMITYSTVIDGAKLQGKGTKKTDKQDVASEAEKGGKQDYVRVLVTGAAKSLVQKYIEIFKYAKLELQAIDTESFALVRSLIGKDRSAILVLDIGSVRTNITVVEKGIPFLTRSINVGGSSITRRLMEQMSIGKSEAEQMKLDLANAPAAAAAAGGLPAVLEAVMQPILHELRYSMQLYGNMELTELKRVEKIIVTGGSSLLPRVPEYFAESLNLNVYRGDPWARVSYPEELRPALDDIGPKMSVAIGLAMREID